MDTLDGGSTSNEETGTMQVIAGHITEVGEGYVILGKTSRISLVDGLADAFHPGQRATITAVLAGRNLIAQKIRASPQPK